VLSNLLSSVMLSNLINFTVKTENFLMAKEVKMGGYNNMN
jgi:hypothetical protein